MGAQIAASAAESGVILDGVSFAEYSKIQAVNLSTLKELRRSPAHYRHRLLAPREDSDSMRLGRAIHAAVLEPDGFLARCALWKDGRRAGKKWDRFEAENAGREILKEDEWDLCLAVQRAVRNDKYAARYFQGGKAEQTVVWCDPETGIRCKARIDYLGAQIADLKTGRDMSPDVFGRQSWKLGNHIQAAMYSDAVAVASGRAPEFVFVAVEVADPHVVQVYRVPDAVFEVGRDAYRSMLRALKEYREQDRWPGYFDGEVDLELPRWAVDSEDEDMNGLGIELGG